MRFFGVQPSELSAMTAADRWALSGEVERIRAREKLDAVNTLALALARPDDDEAKEMRVNLATLAFRGDPRTLAIALEALTRRRD